MKSIRNLMIRLLLWISILSLPPFSAFAQRDEQLWIDYQLSYPFANQFLLENTTTYQTLLNKDGKWRSISISPTFEYTFSRKLDLLSEIAIGYTKQYEGISTFEVDPMVGARYFFTPGKRIDARFVLRYQVRAFREIEAKDWDISNRTRLRGEILISINGPNLFTDKLWYTFLDYEEFIVIDQQVDERYANRRRGRLGLGYRLDYKNRFELSYTMQSTRDEINSEFYGIDNVIQLRYKMYLNPSTPAPTEE